MVLLSCPTCHREVGGYVPKGGDGSAMRPRRHKNPDGALCDGRHAIVDDWYAS